jgi:kynurenine formamidase
LESATSQLGSLPAGALVIRTLPNDRAKLSRNHDEGAPPPYLSAEAAQWLVSSNVEHLIVDLPSIDRASDEGRLTAQRIFWGMPAGATAASSATRAHSTITELAYVDDVVSDGLYLLSLQVAPFEAEAAPSRPILYPLVPACLSSSRSPRHANETRRIHSQRCAPSFTFRGARMAPTPCTSVATR